MLGHANHTQVPLFENRNWRTMSQHLVLFILEMTASKNEAPLYESLDEHPVLRLVQAGGW